MVTGNAMVKHVASCGPVPLGIQCWPHQKLATSRSWVKGECLQYYVHVTRVASSGRHQAAACTRHIDPPVMTLIWVGVTLQAM